MIHIIDYGVGNLGSIRNMISRIGAESVITSDPGAIEDAEKLILPGVGAFGHAMNNLRARGWIEPLNTKVLIDRVPTLGVCLGMQLMTECSEEGLCAGLGWLDAVTVRFRFQDDGGQLKVPHMGWNTVRPRRNHEFLNDLDPEPRFYFVHGYYVACRDEEDVLASCEYGVEFPAVIGRDNLIGTQFHPEKSHRFGMRLLANFSQLKVPC